MKIKYSGAVLFLGLLTLCRALEINECGNRFTCRDGNCGSTALAQADRCNSIINCLDGSDEADCGVCPNGFYCDSGDQCLSSVTDRCDGERDCDDGSDEYNCRTNSVPLSVSAIIGIAVALFVIVILIPGTLCTIVCCCVLYGMIKTTPSDSNKPPSYNNKEPGPDALYALTEIPRQEIEANSIPAYSYPASGPQSTSYCVRGVPLDEIEAYSPPPQAYDPPLDSNTQFGH